MELLFPDEYISSISERMLLYRELDDMNTEESLHLFENSLIDRFGKLPQQAVELLNVVRLRWVAIELNIERIILRDGKLNCYLPSDPSSNYYQSPAFQRLMQWVVQNPAKCVVRESRSKLSINFKGVGSLQQAVDIVREIGKNIN